MSPFACNIRYTNELVPKTRCLIAGIISFAIISIIRNIQDVINLSSYQTKAK